MSSSWSSSCPCAHDLTRPFFALCAGSNFFAEDRKDGIKSPLLGVKEGIADDRSQRPLSHHHLAPIPIANTMRTMCVLPNFLCIYSAGKLCESTKGRRAVRGVLRTEKVTSGRLDDQTSRQMGE